MRQISSVRRALIIGGAREGSIGEAIGNAFIANHIAVARPNREELDPYYASLMQEYLEQYGPFDILVLAQGRANAVCQFGQYTEEEVDELLADNLASHIHAAQAFVNQPDDGHQRHIIILGSMGGVRVFTGSSIYGVAKAGLNHLVRQMAWELTDKGYTVIGVNPGNVQGTKLANEITAGSADFRGQDVEETRAQFNSATQFGEASRPKDVANLVSFLVSGHAEYLAGANIDMPGGSR